MKVLFFARARDLAGVAEADIELARPAKLAEVRTLLAERYPAIADFLPRCVFAINNEYADNEATVANTDQIAVLPPVSGG